LVASICHSGRHGALDGAGNSETSQSVREWVNLTKLERGRKATCPRIYAYVRPERLLDADKAEYNRMRVVEEPHDACLEFPPCASMTASLSQQHTCLQRKRAWSRHSTAAQASRIAVPISPRYRRSDNGVMCIRRLW
jgi:hypothetical protein